MRELVSRKISHTFSQDNLKIALKSALHGAILLIFVQSIPPYNWQVSFTAGWAYGSVMHFLFHWREHHRI
jgi:hypothetical protein